MPLETVKIAYYSASREIVCWKSICNGGSFRFSVRFHLLCYRRSVSFCFVYQKNSIWNWWGRQVMIIWSSWDANNSQSIRIIEFQRWLWLIIYFSCRVCERERDTVFFYSFLNHSSDETLLPKTRKWTQKIKYFDWNAPEKYISSKSYLPKICYILHIIMTCLIRIHLLWDIILIGAQPAIRYNDTKGKKGNTHKSSFIRMFNGNWTEQFRG